MHQVSDKSFCTRHHNVVNRIVCISFFNVMGSPKIHSLLSKGIRVQWFSWTDIMCDVTTRFLTTRASNAEHVLCFYDL